MNLTYPNPFFFQPYFPFSPFLSPHPSNIIHHPSNIIPHPSNIMQHFSDLKVQSVALQCLSCSFILHPSSLVRCVFVTTATVVAAASGVTIPLACRRGVGGEASSTIAGSLSFVAAIRQQGLDVDEVSLLQELAALFAILTYFSSIILCCSKIFYYLCKRIKYI